MALRSPALLALLTGSFLLAGCPGEEQSPHDPGADAALGRSAPARPMESPLSGASMASAPFAPPQPGRRTLAYTHALHYAFPAPDLRPAWDASIRLCRDSVTDAGRTGSQAACEVINASFVSDETAPSAQLTLRASPALLGVYEDALSSGGGVLRSRTSVAEDLSETMLDIERRLALTQTHRDRLAQLYEAPGTSVSDLIIIAREVGLAQTALEDLTAQRATIGRRVDREIVDISFQSMPDQGSMLHPVRQAVRSLTNDLGNSAAALLTTSIMAAPWLAAAGILLTLRRWRGSRAGRPKQGVPPRAVSAAHRPDGGRPA